MLAKHTVFGFHVILFKDHQDRPVLPFSSSVRIPMTRSFNMRNTEGQIKHFQYFKQLCLKVDEGGDG